MLKPARLAQTFDVADFPEAVPSQVEALCARFPYSREKPHATFVHIHPEWKTRLNLGAAESSLDSEMQAFLMAVEQPVGAVATNYGGHQFGHWAGQLGDGRAVLLGEILSETDDVHYELQLKGAGITPFSRRGDGHAVLRSSVREYLASAAFEGLGIATTGALSLAKTGEKVLRDRFYDGNPAFETGALVCRTSESFLRFGHFELFANRRDFLGFRQLFEHTLANFFPELLNSQKDPVTPFLEEVSRRTAHLIAQWQSVGFVHGVMNTDNMSILGQTIDYGPFAFMDAFSPDFTPNTTDLPGRRYAYAAQPNIAIWNLNCLGQCFVEAELCTRKDVEKVLVAFQEQFHESWDDLLMQKLGLASILKQDNEHPVEDDDVFEIINRFFANLEITQMDLNFLLRETAENLRDKPSQSFVKEHLSHHYPDQRILKPWADWEAALKHLMQSRGADLQEVGRKMCEVNPRFVPRNHILQRAIRAAETDDRQTFELIFQMCVRPFEDWAQPEHREWTHPAPPHERTKEVQMNSCSS